jgi:membrane protein YqaA with SNARE-associated domain
MTIGIIASGIVLSLAFQKEITGLGEALLSRAGQGTVDAVLFLLTAVSSTFLALPIWGYALAGVAMGYNFFHLAVVMAFGSATGSLSTMLLGRRIGRFKAIQKRFPGVESHPWTAGRSRWTISGLLFLGTASPIPCDVFYLACGAKKYPAVPFYVTMVAARTVRYCYLALFFETIL